MINQTLRLAKQIADLILEKCWAEPVQSRGPVWTTALWICVACLVSMATRFPIEAILIGASLLVMRWENQKPKDLGRKLPSRRRR